MQLQFLNCTGLEHAERVGADGVYETYFCPPDSMVIIPGPNDLAGAYVDLENEGQCDGVVTCLEDVLLPLIPNGIRNGIHRPLVAGAYWVLGEAECPLDIGDIANRGESVLLLWYRNNPKFYCIVNAGSRSQVDVLERPVHGELIVNFQYAPEIVDSGAVSCSCGHRFTNKLHCVKREDQWYCQSCSMAQWPIVLAATDQ